ncbi:caspase, EACC1-associated type [Nocardia vinacea]|uniref:caspase, EACC1-associated type n=1 Tax=Nocardia vinacea TaxID=96468 RepID=UPI0002E8B782|nr:caspase family protein [Nocardia vinacea]
MGERVHKALLIANWDFPRDPDQLPPLSGPSEDARQLRDVLISQRTGLHDPQHVEILANRTRGAVLRRIEDFFQDADPDDQLLLYYSGHGKLNLFDELHLCAADTTADRLVSSAIGTSAISTIVDASPAGAKILILDCCYSGSFKGGENMPGRLAGEGRFVLTASRGAELAPDAGKDETTSPFTGFLIEALAAEAEDSDGDGYLSIEDVYTYVSDRMRRRQLSRPQRSFAAAVDVIALAKTPSAAGPGSARTSALVSRPRPLLGVSLAVREEVERGRAAERSGQLWVAREAYKRAVDSNAGDWSALAADLLGVILHADGDIAGAKSAYNYVVASGHPEWAPRAAVRLGELAVATGALDDAETAFRQALRASHSTWSPAAANHLADLLAERGETQAARELYEQAARSGHPEWAPRALVMLGTLLAGDGEFMAAKASYRRAVLADSRAWTSEALAKLRDLENPSAP